MKIRLQAGFKPLTLSAKQTQFACTQPTSAPLRCLYQAETVCIIMLILSTAKLILDVLDFSNSNKLFTTNIRYADIFFWNQQCCCIESCLYFSWKRFYSCNFLSNMAVLK